MQPLATLVLLLDVVTSKLFLAKAHIGQWPIDPNQFTHTVQHMKCGPFYAEHLSVRKAAAGGLLKDLTKCFQGQVKLPLHSHSKNSLKKDVRRLTFPLKGDLFNKQTTNGEGST